MNTERAQVGWGFWLWWVLATFVGSAVGVVVAVLGPVLGAVGLAGARVMQWLVLRQQLSRSGWWILASSVGLAATLVVFGVADGSGGGAVTGALEDAIFGAVIGAVVGAITGGVMVWMLRQPAAKELDPS